MEMKQKWYKYLGMIFTASFFVGCCNPAEDIPSEIADRHKYWDGYTAKKVHNIENICTELEQKEGEYCFPEMMAMGDSIYNGVQGLRINWALAEWSVPTYIALRLGLLKEEQSDRRGRDRQFWAPQYPDHGNNNKKNPMNFGLPLNLLTGYPFIINIFTTSMGQRVREQKRNLEYLISHYLPENKRLFVDNISYASAATSDALHWTAGDHRKAARYFINKLGKSSIDAKDTPLIGYAFHHANAAFILNPMREEKLENLTPLDHVRIRKPKRLFINLGSNNGLYSWAFDAKYFNDAKAINRKYIQNAQYCKTIEEQYVDIKNIERNKIDALCTETIEEFTTTALINHYDVLLGELENTENLEYIYINGILKPSLTANLVPRQFKDIRPECKMDGYTDKIIYENNIDGHKDFGFGCPHYVSAAQVKAVDKIIEETNSALQERIKTFNGNKKGKKAAFIDVNAIMEKYDFSGCLAGQYEDSPENIPIENCETKRFKMSPAILDEKWKDSDESQRFCVKNIQEMEDYYNGSQSYDNDKRQFATLCFDNRPVIFAGKGKPTIKDKAAHNIIQGGIFSNDNMHLSDIGYAILAETVRMKMEKVEGEEIFKGKQGEPLVTPAYLYFDAGFRHLIPTRNMGKAQENGKRYFKVLKSFR